MLTPGEFVVNAQATKENLPLLHSINRARGGIIPVSQRRDLPAERDKREKAVSEANAAKEQRYKDIMAARRKTYGIDEPKKSSKPTNLGELARRVNDRNKKMKEFEDIRKSTTPAKEDLALIKAAYGSSVPNFGQNEPKETPRKEIDWEAKKEQRAKDLANKYSEIEARTKEKEIRFDAGLEDRKKGLEKAASRKFRQQLANTTVTNTGIDLGRSQRDMAKLDEQKRLQEEETSRTSLINTRKAELAKDNNPLIKVGRILGAASAGAQETFVGQRLQGAGETVVGGIRLTGAGIGGIWSKALGSSSQEDTFSGGLLNAAMDERDRGVANIGTGLSRFFGLKDKTQQQEAIAKAITEKRNLQAEEVGGKMGGIFQRGTDIVAETAGSAIPEAFISPVGVGRFTPTKSGKLVGKGGKFVGKAFGSVASDTASAAKQLIPKLPVPPTTARKLAAQAKRAESLKLSKAKYAKTFDELVDEKIFEAGLRPNSYSDKNIAKFVNKGSKPLPKPQKINPPSAKYEKWKQNKMLEGFKAQESAKKLAKKYPQVSSKVNMDTLGSRVMKAGSSMKPYATGYLASSAALTGLSFAGYQANKLGYISSDATAMLDLNNYSTFNPGIGAPKYSTGGIVKNIDQITASSRGYSSGGVVNMNSGGPVGGGVSSSIDGLGSKMDDFINKLTGAIPTSVSMEGNHNISASITGGHQLQSLLEGPFSEIVRNAINNAFATRSQQNEGSTA
jgi:hypothetical protein